MGEAVPIPKGETGPTSTANGKGYQYQGGSGGSGLSPKASNVRVMDPTPAKGPSPGHPGGYVNYTNSGGQSINPFTGNTVGKADMWWRIPLIS
jgi:hypothetical protein